jgi:hypothetical protein
MSFQLSVCNTPQGKNSSNLRSMGLALHSPNTKVREKMQKQIGPRLIALLLIGVLLLLLCHVHPSHFYVRGEHEHCVLCQILQCGFTHVSFFILIPLSIVIILVRLSPNVFAKFNRPTVHDGRAPPVNSSLRLFV